MKKPRIIEVRRGWSRGEGAIPSGMIRRLDDSFINHIYWVFVFNNGLELIYESHIKGGVQITPYKHLTDAIASGKVEIVHEQVVDCTEKERYELWRSCVELHGCGYDTGQIIRYYLWIRLFEKKGEKILRLYDDGKYTCNELHVKTGKEILKAYSELDYSYTPERLFRFFHDGMTSKQYFG